MHESLRKLEGLIPQCMAPDRAVFRRRLKGARRLANSNEKEQGALPAILQTIERDMQRSIARRAARAGTVPAAIPFNEDLPVSQAREQIRAALCQQQAGAGGHGTDSQVIVVSGDTGSGKTTVLPKIALLAGRGVDGAIALTQPRRIAARSVATWIARDLGTQLGQTVGFKVRFDDRTSGNSLIRVVTDGVLLAEIEHDPDLRRYDTIILDEAHERSLNIDFLLGYLKQLLPRRPDLKLIIASATLDVDRFSAHFGGAPNISVGGRMYPIEVRYHAEEGEEVTTGAESDNIVDRVVSGVEECTRIGPGDVLAFLGGEREITECVDALRRVPALAGAEILPLFARLTAAEQDRIFSPPPAATTRRVIVATNIAETSVTVPGIRFVVDSGVARIARWSGKNRVLRLPIEPVSRASADQRKGRCGRVGPGVCIRLYSEQDFADREPFTPPELLRSNLASVILQMKALKLGDIESFPFIDAPSPRLIAEGVDTLLELGALDRHHALTDLGRAMSRLPVDPRIARMILASVDRNCLPDALVLAAFLSIQDVRERPQEAQGAADAAQLIFNDPAGDTLAALKIWRAWRAECAQSGSSAQRRWARTHFLSHARLREWTELVDQLTRICQERLKLAVTNREPGTTLPALPDETNAPALHRALLAGFPCHLAQRTDQGDYITASGGHFQLFPGSMLARRSSGWVVCAEIVETAKRWGRMAARVQGDWIEEVAPHLLQRTRSEPHWVRATGQVAAWERVRYGALTVVPRRRVPYGPVAPVEARTIFIQSALVEGDCSLDPARAPFVAHNASVLSRVEAMEAKRRERGALLDNDARFRFFDARVPADVHSLPAFERWRAKAERHNPQLLFMQSSDLLVRDPGDLGERFPDTMDLAAGSKSQAPSVAHLSYEHLPGDDSDGVTLEIPIHALHSVDEQQLEWLVPGMIEAKIEALMRSLPKRLRLRFFPLKEFAQGAVEALPFGQGNLRTKLADYLSRAGGTRVDPADFEADQLPSHLRMQVRVVDDAGKQLAAGRDLHDLRAQLAPAARKRQATDLRAAFGPEWQRSGLTAFELDSLPEKLEGTLGGRRIVAYPALRDDGKDVSLVLHTDPTRAERETQRGLRRLFAVAAQQAIQHHLEFLSEHDELESEYAAAMGTGHAAIWPHISTVAAGIAFVDGQPIVRTPAEFEARLDQGSDRLWDAIHAATDQSLQILRLAAQIRTGVARAPESWRDATEDILAHLNALCPPDVLSRATAEERAELPRYLRGLQVRLERLAGGGYARDRQKQAQIDHWRAELARAEATLAAEGGDSDLLAPFRMLLEEYRVSLFAQGVRTAVPVSAERLERAWLETTPFRRPPSGKV